MMDLTGRSICDVKVAAVISDSHGIFAWGWNNIGFDGFGMHAEAHAIHRANRARLRNAVITVAGRRGKWLNSKPCEACQALIDKWGLRAEWFDGEVWHVLDSSNVRGV